LLYHIGESHPLGQWLERVFLVGMVPAISLIGDLALQLGYAALEIVLSSLSLIKGPP
jgi:hypothetical protein